jgi:hypothetical protein
MRIRWPFTIIWTVLCLAAVAKLVDGASAPVAPGCFESCSLGADLARFLIPWIVVVWLGVTLLAAWLWGRATRIGCPRCGRPVDPPVRVCPNCSYDLLQGVEPPDDPGPPPAGLD